MRTPWIGLGALVVGCRVDYRTPGTSVGNPGEMAVRWAPGAGAEVSGTVPVAALVATPCLGGGELRVEVGRDLEPGPGESLELPAGKLCQLRLEVSGPVALQITDGEGAVAAADLVVSTIRLSSPGVEVDGQAFVLELGQPDWVAAGSVDEVAMAEVLARASGLYLDDGDGALSEAERAAGAVAGGDDRHEDEDDTGEDDD